MYAQSGKKLVFMGGEIGQVPEWNHEAGLEWWVLQFPYHAGVKRFLSELNRLYRTERAMHELDADSHGFEWIDCSDVEHSVIALLRKGRSADELVLGVFNFTPMPRYDYHVGVPRDGFWLEVLNSDAREYAGSGIGNFGGQEAQHAPAHGRPASLVLALPPLSAVFFKWAGARP
jgi:1,4-alpha-glucan branching enzyme